MATAYGATPRLTRRSRTRPAAPALSRGQRWAFVAALFTFALASGVTGVFLFERVSFYLFPDQTFTSISAKIRLDDILPSKVLDVAPDAEDSGFNKRVTILMLGLDSRPGDRWDDAYRTDSIMVATVDPVARQVSMLSFPRDLLVDLHLPNFNYTTRINESYVYGFQREKSIVGAVEQVRKDLLMNFGVKVDHWVVVDLQGVKKLVDAVGGVDVDIPADLHVPTWYYSEERGDTEHYVSFDGGPQHLDGYNAVAFSRYREDSDFKRVKRQQLVLQAAIQQVFARGMLANAFDLPQYWDVYSSSVRTDIGKGSLPRYAALLKLTQGQPIRTFSLGDPIDDRPTVRTGMYGDASVVFWDADNVNTIIQQFFTKSVYGGAAVEVIDGYRGDGGLRANQLGRYLRYGKGLPLVWVGPDVTPQSHTVIRLNDPNKREMAEDIATWLGLPKDVIQVAAKHDETTPDVVIIIGLDFEIPGS